jgi:hypothetical protein
MAETIQTSENEVKVSATGKRLTYDGVQWYRKDLYDLQHVCILQEQEVVRELKNEIRYLRILLDDAGVEWKVGGGGQ